MATTHTRWFGVVVEFDNHELTQITANLNSGAAGVGTLAAILAAMGITGPAALVSGIVTALLTLGSALLSGCNSNQRGIVLYVLWVGLPWCRAR